MYKNIRNKIKIKIKVIKIMYKSYSDNFLLKKNLLFIPNKLKLQYCIIYFYQISYVIQIFWIILFVKFGPISKLA